jgi:outer membrane protein assembly factor BamE (lipoprotein component of BamABCDE complex)
MNRFAPLFLALVLSACATSATSPKQVARLQDGMTLQQVNALLGKPYHVRNEGALTTYDYVFNQGQPTASSYYVIIGRDGLVRSFGPNSGRGPE